MQIDRARALCWFRVTMLFVVVGLASSCIGPTRTRESRLDQLRDEISLDVAYLSPRDVVIPHEISAETLNVIDARVSELDHGQRGARGLIALLFGPEHLDLGYEWAATRGADSTIAAGAGNCLSLSAVLVAVVRAYGGAARYVEVESNLAQQRDGDLEVWSSHVAVLVAGRAGPLIVDFLGVADPAKLRFRILSDRSLVAHYYNDRGYELIHLARSAGEATPWKEARRQFEIATEIDTELGRAWNNLGVALTRLGEFEAAEEAYRRALEDQHDYPGKATVLNLANLETRRRLVRALQETGRVEPR